MGSSVTCALPLWGSYWLALPGAGGGGRRPDFSAARRALNASSVLDPAPDGLKVDCLWVASDVPIFLMAAASFRLCCLLKDMIVSAILSGCTGGVPSVCAWGTRRASLPLLPRLPSPYLRSRTTRSEPRTAHVAGVWHLWVPPESYAAWEAVHGLLEH